MRCCGVLCLVLRHMFCGTLTRRLVERTGEDQPWETRLCVEGADMDSGVPMLGSVKEYAWGRLGDRKLTLAASKGIFYYG